MLLELKRFEIPPGERILLKDVTWYEFEKILYLNFPFDKTP